MESYPPKCSFSIDIRSQFEVFKLQEKIIVKQEQEMGLLWHDNINGKNSDLLTCLCKINLSVNPKEFDSYLLAGIS